MARPVLAFLDGSPLADHAVPWAAELAARTGAELRLVQVHVPAVSVAPEGLGVAYTPAEDAVVRKGEEEHLARVRDAVLSGRPELAVAAVVLDLDSGADIADTLAGYAARASAGFAVLTTHGRGPFTRFWLGSVADEFVRHATVPALLLRPEAAAPPAPAARPEVRRVLVPLDGSELAEAAVPPAALLARRFGAEVTLLLVMDPGPLHGKLPALDTHRLPGDWAPAPPDDQARAYLERVAARLADQGLAVETKVVHHRSAADSILEHTRRHPGELVALATHGRGGLARLLLGGVADKVIRGATGPVLVVRPAG